MDRAERHNRIIHHLRVKPVSHGQVYTFQIAIPASEPRDITPERRELLECSLREQGSNLMPLIVRRTEAYEDEEKEYEVVYGADWCVVAEELEIEKLWVWVFDLTDEQAEAVRLEMEQLAAGNGQPPTDPPPSKPVPTPSPNGEPIDIEALSQQLVQQLGGQLTQQLERSLNAQLTPLTEKIEQIQEITASSAGGATTNIQLKPLPDGQFSELTEKLDRILENTNLGSLEGLSKHVEDIRKKARQSNKQEAIALLSDAAKQVAELTRDLEELRKVDLRLASQEEIKRALSEAGVKSPQIDPALVAIEYWKQEGRTLTWENLKKSHTGKKPVKVPNFGSTTYNKLMEIAKISE